MENKDFISETIRYQKAASDQVYEMLALYQSNSEAQVQQILDQCDWFPDISKESYLSWSDNYQKATSYLKTIVDTGFEQVECACTPPMVVESAQKTEQPKLKTATPSKAPTVEKKPQKTSRPKTSEPATSKPAATKVKPPTS